MTTLKANGISIRNVEKLSEEHITGIMGHIRENISERQAELQEWTGVLALRGVLYDGYVQDALFE